jgi:putative redox protein
MDAQITWQKKLNFTGKSDSGFELHLGSAEEGFRPMELFAIGLVGCTGMDVISILEKKRQDITDFEVKAHIDRADEHPKVFTQARIEYFITGRGVEEGAVIRSIELSANRYCPAQAMFQHVFPIELVYSIFEDLGEGKRKLVKSGTFDPAQEIVN